MNNQPIFVLVGVVDYESEEILGVFSEREFAEKTKTLYQENGTYFDRIQIDEFELMTGVIHPK